MRISILCIATALSASLFLTACSGSQSGQKEQNNAEQNKKEQASESGTESGNSSEYATLHPAYAEVNSPDEEINCWGDSITEGYGGDELTYPDVLAQLTGMPVRNLGVGGDGRGHGTGRKRLYFASAAASRDRQHASERCGLQGTGEGHIRKGHRTGILVSERHIRGINR